MITNFFYSQKKNFVSSSQSQKKDASEKKVSAFEYLTGPICQNLYNYSVIH